MGEVGTTNISFSGLRTAWGNASYSGGSDPGATDISLSEFYGATFTDGNNAPASGEISISDFSGKTFADFKYNWRYYAYGSTMGTMRVYWFNGTTLYLLREPVIGQQHAGTGLTWNSYTENLTNYAGETGYIVYAYQTGSNFYNDPQIDDMYVTKNSATLASIGPSETGWKRWAEGTSTADKIEYTTSLSIPDITSSKWVTLLTSSSTTYGWQVDSGGTPSGSTGNTVDATGSASGTYIYFEGSNPNFSSSGASRYYWLRTANPITLS